MDQYNRLQTSFPANGNDSIIQSLFQPAVYDDFLTVRLLSMYLKQQAPRTAIDFS